MPIVTLLPNGYARGVLPKSASEWIKGIRDRTGLSQTAFADKLGRSRPTISEWETGKAEPDWHSVSLVLAAFPVESVPVRGKVVKSASVALEAVLVPFEAKVTMGQAKRLRALAAELDRTGCAMTDTGLVALVHALAGPEVVPSEEPSDPPVIRRRAGR